MGAPVILGKQKMSAYQSGLDPSKITIASFPGMSMGYITKETNKEDTSFGVKVLLYEQLLYPTWNFQKLSDFSYPPNNYHHLYKGLDTV